MQKSLLLKIVIIVVLTFFIAISLGLVGGTITERMNFRDEAVRSVAADSVREQSVIGPVLVIPYLDEYKEVVAAQESADKKTTVVDRVVHKNLIVYPDKLQVTGNIDIDQRYRGIHKVLVYSGRHAISGNFLMPDSTAFERNRDDSKIALQPAYIAMGIDDVRGIHNIPSVNLNGKLYEFQQGGRLPALASGLNAPIGFIDFDKADQMQFSLNLELDGIERLSFTPVGKNNEFTLSSNWPHPQFTGRFLPSPKTRKIDENGFHASWSISSLATNAQQQLSALNHPATSGTDVPASTNSLTSVDSFSVGFIEPINIYSQADRAVKYGLLFVALTFAAFFLFEVLKQLPIHPVQYALVGSSLVLFFLLLVSLSEHISFAHAYLAASSACIFLNGFYLAHVLRSWKRGAGFGAALTLLYGVLYGVLQSENNALLMGSSLLFAVLAAIMIATRKVDWYQIGKGVSTPKVDGVGELSDDVKI